MMALGDKEDLSCSLHGQSYSVVLYCYTCQTPICARCVACTTPTEIDSAHHEHMFLDIVEACEIFKGEIEKLHGKLFDYQKQKKVLKTELLNRVQNLKIELLRLKTVLQRRATGLKDTVDMKHKEFGRCLESVIQPAIERSEQHYRNVDFDVVSGDGLLGMLDSLQGLASHKAVTFLKGFSNLRTSVENHFTHTAWDSTTYKDDLVELENLKLIDINFQREKTFLTQSFICPTIDLPKPRILSKWSTVGSNSASLVWRCNSPSSAVRSFFISYRVCSNLSLSHEQISSINDPQSLHQAGFTCLKLKRLNRKRSYFVIRNLCPKTDYVVSLVAFNDLAQSLPCVIFFRTLEATHSGGCILNSSSRQSKISDFVIILVKRTCMLLLGAALLLYFLLTGCVLFVYYEQLRDDLCSVSERIDWKQAREWTCQVSSPPRQLHVSSPAAAVHVVTDFFTDIETWLSHFLKRPW